MVFFLFPSKLEDWIGDYIHLLYLERRLDCLGLGVSSDARLACFLLKSSLIKDHDRSVLHNQSLSPSIIAPLDMKRN